MANEGNLMPIQEVNSRRSREQHLADSRKGGIKSAEKRREQRTMREEAQRLLASSLNEQGIARLKRMGVKTGEKNPSVMTAFVMGQINGAMNGNAKCAEFVKDLVDINGNDGTSAQSFIDALNGTEEADNGDIEE